MGYMRHHAIVVTAPDHVIFDDYRKACEIFGKSQVSDVVGPRTNGYCSFLIAPDGSKERWEESNIGDVHRDLFVEHLAKRRYSDGSTCVDWVEVQFGDDEHVTTIVRHSDERQRMTAGEMEI